ncbi:hypothetical protein ACLIKD_11200 [Azonexus sp. IMCC34842]|uniref:hypothetical protein n=1 Tax=Azonexus sp. IMCC34842 TaxID=3420950 RepID=UPI003D09B067
MLYGTEYRLDRDFSVSQPDQTGPSQVPKRQPDNRHNLLSLLGTLTYTACRSIAAA